MNHIFFKIYYTLFLYILFGHSYDFFNTYPSRIPAYVMFASPLNFFDFPIWIHSIIFLSSLLLCFLCILSPSKYLRILTSVFILLFFSIKYSYGKIDHSYHIWMISSVLMCFVFPSQPITSKINQFFIRLTQSLLLSHYFISGLWKLRSIIASDFQTSFSEMTKEYIAYGLAESGIEVNMFLGIILYKFPWLLSFGYLFVLGFQLSSLVPVFFNRLFVFYGFLAVLFHFLTGFTLNIYFTPTVLAVLFFLIITEFLIEKEKGLYSVKR